MIVRRSDRSVYSQPGLKAVLSLNGHSRNGLVSDESITWHDISAPNTLGNHVVTISLLINDQTIFSQPISITVVTGPPGAQHKHKHSCTHAHVTANYSQRGSSC